MTRSIRTRSLRMRLIGPVLVALSLGLPGSALAAFGIEAETPLQQAPAVPGRAEPFVRDIAVSPNGSVYVTFGAEVQRYSRSGRLETRWGGYGSGPGHFGGSGPPWAAGEIAVDGGGRVYVYDVGNDRIQKFTADGAYLGSISRGGAGPGGPSAGEPASLAADAAGNLFVNDPRGLRKLSPTGQLLASRSDFGSGHIAAGFGRLYLQRFVIFTASPTTLAPGPSIGKPGRPGFSDGTFGDVGPNDLSATANGVWVDNRDLKLFSPSGKLLDVCARPIPKANAPAAYGEDVYSYSRTRLLRYGPDARLSKSCDKFRPELRQVRLSRKRVPRVVRGRKARRTILAYSLNEASRVTVTWKQVVRGRRSGQRCRRLAPGSRRRSNCVALLRRGKATLKSAGGRNRKRLVASINGRPLPVGRYRLDLQARDTARNKSKTTERFVRVY